MIPNPYNQMMPLISLHVPKCGGQSLFKSISECHQSGFRIIEFYPEVGKDMPDDWNSQRTIIHGHFVRWKNHPVEAICPAVHQYTTVIRDPFDILISGYFYGLQNNHDWATKQSLNSFLDWWLDTGTSPLFGALPSLGNAQTIEEYAKGFLLIGILEHLDLYVEQLGKMLGVRITPPKIINVSRYVSEIPDRRAEFRNGMSLDYELYDYVNFQSLEHHDK